MVIMLLQNNIYQEHWVQSASQSVMASALQAGKERKFAQTPGHRC